MAVRRWNEAIDGPFSETALRRKLETAGYIVARCVHPPGTVFPERSEAADRINAILAGRYRMVVAGHLAVLGRGDWVEVATGVRHSAAVIGDEPVVALHAVRV